MINIKVVNDPTATVRHFFMVHGRTFEVQYFSIVICRLFTFEACLLEICSVNCQIKTSPLVMVLDLNVK